MYVPEAAFDAQRLLQGDVVFGIQLVGAINLRGIHHHTPVHGEGRANAWTVPQEPKIGAAMVLSHSCEIALENNVKLTSVVLAPIRDVNQATSPERISELVTSNRIDKSDTDWSYLKYFYLELTPRLPFSRGAVVDFSKLFSVRKQAFAHVLEKKVLQLEDEVRTSMALKLALYFHREETVDVA